MGKINVGMDVVSDLASELVDYIWYSHVHKGELTPPDHSFTAENGDITYVDEAQDIFNTVLDIVDDELNPEKDF